MDQRITNPLKLHQELEKAGLPVIGVSSDGRVDYSRNLTNSEKSNAEQIITAYDPTITTEQDPLLVFHQRGISSDQLLVALWKNVVMGDESETQRISLELGS